MAEPITSFSGQHAFLSNFHPSDMIVPWLGNAYAPTLEHAFQAFKAKDEEHVKWVLAAPTPGQAKRRGRKVPLREDWDSIKLLVMENLVRLKFRPGDIGGRGARNPLAEMLVATGDAELIEGNTWGDTFWGICDGKGQNHLGKILMEIRAELQQLWKEK